MECLELHIGLFYFADIDCGDTFKSTNPGGSVTYNCTLQHIDIIKQIQISELDFHRQNKYGLNGTFSVNEHVTLTIDMAAVDRIKLAFDNVDCSQDGYYTIHVNNITQDDVKLTITGMLTFIMIIKWHKELYIYIEAATSENVSSNMCAHLRLDKPAYSRSLIRIYNGRVYNFFSFGQLRL